MYNAHIYIHLRLTKMNPYRMLRKKSWTKGGTLQNYTHIDITHIEAIDQGKTKACFLASLLYLQQFRGNKHRFDDFKVKKGYRTIADGLKDFPQLAQGITHVRLRPERVLRSTPKPNHLQYLRNLLDQGLQAGKEAEAQQQANNVDSQAHRKLNSM